MCGIPFADDHPKLVAARQDPKVMADQITAAFIDFLRTECSVAPIVLVLEDLHWSDALTVKLADAALRALEDQPLLILALARPEVHDVFPKLWDDRAQVVVLRPLSRKAGERLVLQILGKDIASNVVSRIVQQSEGNALFLEELIRGVAEGHGEEAPPTVLAMLQSRIGRLPSQARRVLRIASIFGETTWQGGMHALFAATLPHHGLDEALRLLTAAEILELRPESRFPQEQEYRFRHALMRDAAYGLLTDDERIQGHRLAGEWLEAMHEQDAVVIAEHFVQGRQAARALKHFVQAAEQCCENGDTNGTMAIATRGLAQDPDPVSRGALLATMADAYVWREQYVEVMQVGLEALELLVPGSKRWCHLMQDLMPAAAFTGQQDRLFELSTRLSATDPAPDAANYYVAAASWVSISCGIMGQKAACDTFLHRAEQVAATLPPTERVATAYFKGAQSNHDHLVEEAQWSCMVRNREACAAANDAGLTRLECLTCVYYGKALMDLGDIRQAENVLRENLAVAEKLGDAMSLAYARTYLARLLADYAPMESLDEPLTLAEQIIATKNQSLAGLAYGIIAQVEYRRQNLDTAEKAARMAVEATQYFPTYSWDLVALLMSILLVENRPDEALAIGKPKLALLESLGVGGFGEIHLRLAVAEALFATGSVDAANDALRVTIDRLRLRVENIPDMPIRERYLTRVPTHARILMLAERWLGDIQAIRQQVGLSNA